MRKTRAKKRPLLPDPRFNDPLVTRFVNNMMYDGKKSTAFKIFYDAIDLVSERTGEANGLDQWKTALTNVMPHVEVRSRRVGGATFQIPQQIRQPVVSFLQQPKQLKLGFQFKTPPTDCVPSVCI